MNLKRDIHKLVKKAYGAAAKEKTSCCSKNKCCVDAEHPLPQADLGLSCGNPVAFAEIHVGDVVLDLGSGAGRDVFLAAQETGPQGKVIGLDMTPEMLDLARKNAAQFTRKTSLSNVEFVEGEIENIPLADESIDVVISNCVINLSPDKPRVFREVFRVLRAGGRMIVSDIVLNKPLPENLEANAELYSACIAGALLREDYLAAINSACFSKVTVLADHLYQAESCCDDPVTSGCADALAGVAASVTIKAVK